MATIVDPGAKEICLECKKTGITTPAFKAIYVDTGDVDTQSVPLCKRHYDELRAAVQGLERAMDGKS